MADEKKITRSSYLTKNVGEYSDVIEIMGLTYEKAVDLRYGTNPHQTAAHYRPRGASAIIGSMEVLKTGKSGLSQTNLEDISYSLNICKFFQEPCCACMKHVNPSGAAVEVPGDSLVDVYRKARDCDPRAAFGSVVAFNGEVGADVAAEIMTTFVECVVAPAFTDDALEAFSNPGESKLNRHIRILRCGDLATLPRFVGDDPTRYRTLKVLADGSVVVADPLLSHVRGVADLKPAQGSSKALGDVQSTVEATPEQMRDLLVAWYVNLNVRSNGVVIVKDGGTVSVGTGEQDRVGAVEQAVWKYENKYKGPASIEGAAMASDGFFPFPDAVEVAADAGVRAVVSPAGSLGDAKVIARANELGVALRHAPERIFSHH